MTPSQLALSESKRQYTVGELKRLAPIARARGDRQTAQLIAAAIVRRWDDESLPVNEQAAAALEELAR